MAQFVIGFIPALRLAKAAKVAGGTEAAARLVGGSDKAAKALGGIVEAEVAAGAGTAAVFDGAEQRLSNLIQQYPALANPVTEFLAADPSDGKAEGKLKLALEGLGFTALVQPFVAGLRMLRAARVARPAGESRPQSSTAPDTSAEMVDDAVARQRTDAGEVAPSPIADQPHISVPELDRMVDEAVSRPHFRSIRTEPASQINLEFPRDWSPLPYRAETKATTVRLTRQSEGEFVRVHGTANQPGQWIMRKEDLFDSNGRQISPKELRQKFSLPIVPTEVSDVVIPVGTEMRIGVVSFREGESGGNVIQYDLMYRPPKEWFRNRRPLER